MRRTRWLAALLLLILVGAYLGRATLLPFAGHWLVVEDRATKSDAIVVLAGSLPDRVLEAVDLYNQGLAPVIVLSREPEPRGYAVLKSRGLHVPTPHQLNEQIALQLGVPRSNLIETGGKPGSTLSEAEDLVRFLFEQRFFRVLLVTSKYHTRRAGLIYRRLGGERLTVITRPSHYDPYDPDHWWQNRTQLRRAVIEYQKLAAYLLMDSWRIGPVGVAEKTS